MDQESVVYGCIKGSSSLSPAELFEQVTVNKKAIMSLPKFDEWPSLTQDMFSVPRFNMSGNYGQTNVIHFGLAYQRVEYEWSQWMKKFENLLKSMYWQSVVVHLETELTGVHNFIWESTEGIHQPGTGNFNIRCEWSHEMGLAGRTA